LADLDIKWLDSGQVVNSILSGDQHHATVAMTSSGYSFVVWQQEGSVSGSCSIHGRLIDPNDTLGTEIDISGDAEDVSPPDVVTIYVDGRHCAVVTWAQRDAGQNDFHVYVSCLDGTMSPRLGLERTKVTTQGFESKLMSFPDVTALDPATTNAHFFVTWGAKQLTETGNKVLNHYGRIFAANGEGFGATRQMNTEPGFAVHGDNCDTVSPANLGLGFYGLPDVDVLTSGKGVVVWEQVTCDCENPDDCVDPSLSIRSVFRRFDVVHNDFWIDPVEQEICEECSENDYIRRPMVDVNSVGAVLAWVQHPADDPNSQDVHFRRLNLSTLGIPICPHPGFSGKKTRIVAQLDEVGRVFVSWTEYHGSGSYGAETVMKFYDSMDVPISLDIASRNYSDEYILRLHEDTTQGDQIRPAQAWRTVGGAYHFVTTWESTGEEDEGLDIGFSSFEVREK